MKPEELKLLEEPTGRTLPDTGTGTGSPNKTPFAQESRLTTDTWDFIKLKGFPTAKEQSMK